MLGVIVLAAGRGTRMKRDTPKVLHPVCSKPLVSWVLDIATHFSKNVVVVSSPELKNHSIFKDVSVCVQNDPKGTGDAVKTALPYLPSSVTKVLILCGDTPLLTIQSLDRLVNYKDECVFAFYCQPNEPYGRLLTDGKIISKVIEYKDATDDQKAITLANSGVMVVSKSRLLTLFNQEPSPITGEYYLTDVLHGVPFITSDQSEFQGVNTLRDLLDVESLMQKRLRQYWQNQGVYFKSEYVLLAFDTQFGHNTIVHPFVTFGTGVIIGDDSEIFSHTHIEDTVIGRSTKIGPFAHLKAHSQIYDHVHVGNFVEIKKSTLKNNSKVKHLSYIGDSTIGQYTNIGAGTITCNYDGVQKHQTIVGDECFIGANSTIIAPIHLKNHCKIAAGSVITEDVPEGGLAFGRARQVNKAV